MLVFYDTETSDKWNFRQPVDSPLQPHIVQLAALFTDSKGNELNYFSTLIAPTKDYNFTIQPGAEATHHISQEMCKKYGVHINAAILMFSQLVMNCVAVAAHNIDFDSKVTAATYKRIKRPDRVAQKPNICTMKIYTPILKLPPARKGTKYKWPTLDEVYFYLFKEHIEGAHDAMVDVRALKRIYFELLEQERGAYELGKEMPVY